MACHTVTQWHWSFVRTKNDSALPTTRIHLPDTGNSTTAIIGISCLLHRRSRTTAEVFSYPHRSTDRLQYWMIFRLNKTSSSSCISSHTPENVSNPQIQVETGNHNKIAVQIGFVTPAIFLGGWGIE